MGFVGLSCLRIGDGPRRGGLRLASGPEWEHCIASPKVGVTRPSIDGELCFEHISEPDDLGVP